MLHLAQSVVSTTRDEHASTELPGAHLGIMNAAQETSVAEFSTPPPPTPKPTCLPPKPPPPVTADSATQPVSEVPPPSVTAETQPAPNATPRHHDTSGKAESIYFDIYEFWSTRDTYGADFILSQGCSLSKMFFVSRKSTSLILFAYMFIFLNSFN